MDKRFIDEARKAFNQTSSIDELNRLMRTLTDLGRDRFADLQKQVGNSFHPGDDVFFLKGKRDPEVIHGKLVRIKGKFAYVKSSNCVGREYDWRVSPSMLQHHTPGK